MMTIYTLHVTLESDAAFGRGDGLAWLIDREVEHDEYGLPYLKGRTLKGLLVEECANILYALAQREEKAALAEQYQEAADRLFGQPGSVEGDSALMRVGDARLPDDLCVAVQHAVESGVLSSQDILESLTDVRRQTAMDETGRPQEHSLRATRVLLSGAVLESQLAFSAGPTPFDLGLLAACVKALRRAGTSRNRGFGRLRAELKDAQGNHVTDQEFEHFKEVVE